MAEPGLALARLDLEIAKSVLLNDSAEILPGVHRLRVVGVQISMNDFGTGSSSLSYLDRFPLDRIKIDRSFVNNLAAGREALAVVGPDQTPRMITTAEGVATREQLEILRADGCDEAQGWRSSRARPAERVPEILARALCQRAETTGGRQVA